MFVDCSFFKFLFKGLASEKWESLVLALIGDTTGIGEEICGCVASIRFQEVTREERGKRALNVLLIFIFLQDIIAVWNRDASDEAKKAKICEAMRVALDLPKGTLLEYKVRLFLSNFSS
jgi:hypothetical protein